MSKLVDVILAEVLLSPKEVEQLVDQLDNTAQKNPVRAPIDRKGGSYSITGYIEADLHLARPIYRAGALLYGPVLLKVHIDQFHVSIDWNKDLGIPKHYCITIFQACGKKLEYCWDLPLGVWNIDLLSNIDIVNSATSFNILDVDFRDDGDKRGFNLYGKLALISAITELLTTGLLIRITETTSSLVEEFLRRILGNGEIAKLFIKVIMSAFRAIERVLDFIAGIVTLLIQPIDEVLQNAFGDGLEIKLSNDPLFPKSFELMKAEGKHKAVNLSISKPPDIDVGHAGITLKVLG